MAGKIIADQIEHSTAGSLDTSYVVNGTVKSWCNHQQAATYVVRDSFSISSIDDTGTGSTRLNFSSAFATTGYSQTQTFGEGGPNRRSNYTIYDYTTTSVQMQTVNSGDSYDDATFCNSITIGDLA